MRSEKRGCAAGACRLSIDCSLICAIPVRGSRGANRYQPHTSSVTCLGNVQGEHIIVLKTRKIFRRSMYMSEVNRASQGEPHARESTMQLLDGGGY